MAATIDDLVAEMEIRQLQYRYCRAVDRTDFDLLRNCFHPDAQTDYGFFGGDVDAFIAAGRASLAAFVRTTHFTGNQLIEVSGEVAWAEHYTLATHRIAADTEGAERDFVTSVRYVDRVERRGGVWLIAKRSLVVDWVRTDPVEPLGPDPQAPRGSRGSSDPSYHVAGERIDEMIKR